MPRYSILVSFSVACTLPIEADSEDEALEKANDMDPDDMLAAGLVGYSPGTFWTESNGEIGEVEPY